ncbi:hypothetical protein DFJ74DRAFT_773422 [Hyaloraphidium curvatum]|nr:hypothetical protein DFJ74DRAFT_773422 [Hyaloraphidium curvatum]
MSAYEEPAVAPALPPAPPDPRQDAALAALGVSKSLLTPAEVASFDRDGFLVLPAILSEDETRAIEDFISTLERAEGDAVGKDHQIEEGVVRVGNMVSKDTAGVCRPLLLNPKILAAVQHVFGGRAFHLESLTSRRVLPGHGLQPIHRDNVDRTARGANCLVALSPFTLRNGAPRAIPGTHTLAEGPREVLKGRGATIREHPGEVILEAPRGSVVVNIPFTYHGGTRNDSPDPRLGMHMAFYESRADFAARRAPVPASVAEKVFSEDERDILGLRMLSEDEFGAWKKGKVPTEWIKIDQQGWQPAAAKL